MVRVGVGRAAAVITGAVVVSLHSLATWAGCTNREDRRTWLFVPEPELELLEEPLVMMVFVCWRGSDGYLMFGG